MSSYYGKYILFDGTSSEEYGLRIVNFDSGTSDGESGGEPTIHSKWLFKRSKNFFYGRSQNSPLQLNITLASEEPIDAIMRSSINRWLLGRNDYLPLIIVQDDMYDIQFDFLCKKITPKFIGNQERALVISGECSSPWGYEYPKTLIKTYSGSALVNETFNFLSTSDNDDYLYPSVIFHTNGTVGGSNCSFFLTNHTDGSRICSYTGLSGSEIVTTDCDLGIITSNLGLLRMSKFNKNFFRLVPGNNRLTLSGSLVSFQMTTISPKKVGA